ncbi:glycerol kinase GlpK [Solicola gregarius]|uniref:glycerol kinase n=1 Tax=Solicola gregarius TaxID=2908642 RepID=A0AA46TFD6_9ACTN|nr:glycerol kinase GlpK [Solicola gregarius]UYM04225.1 glycerol kinase GlpK [Solicola gregarius]
MSGSVIAAIDQGTTSTRCLLFDHDGRMLAVAQREHHHTYPRPGWVQHDADEIWRIVEKIVPNALRDADASLDDVAALGIANQRETTVVWDPHTGRTLAPAITWQDTRTDSIVEQIEAAGHVNLFRELAGLHPSAYFSGPRLRWLLDNVPRLEERARTGRAMFGTMESWLVWKLTGGPDGGVHVTDVTNASRTMMMNLRTLEWDQRLLDVLDIPEQMLPEIRPNSQVYGRCSAVLPGVRIGGAIGDQQAALFGQTCFASGEAKCTYGTGAFLLVNTGDRIIDSSDGLIPTVAYVDGDGGARYALEGSIAMTGSLVQWLRDALEMIPSAPQIETLARTVDDNGGCYIVPAFSGLFAPRWRPDARGVIVGLTSYVEKGHLARAVLEATGWQTWEVVEAIKASHISLRSLRVDGGMTANHLLMQFIADVLDVPVERPLVSETVSLGAAYVAGLAVGYWADLAVLRRNWHRAALWRPAMDPTHRAGEAHNWNEAVTRTLGWGTHAPR